MPSSAFRRSIIAFAFSVAAQFSAAQQTEAKPPLMFEVASVKPSKPGGRGGGIRPLSGGQTYVASNATLRLMILLMYKITDSQIVGGPDWMNAELFDVDAKAEKPSSLDDLHVMFQKSSRR